MSGWRFRGGVGVSILFFSGTGGRKEDPPAEDIHMRPNLIIIGAMKCGTTSLHYYLNLHPQIKMSKPKELNFFIENRNWKRGVDWYRSNFSGDQIIHGESSPNYTDHRKYPGVPERMYSLVPEAKLIYMVRDPIERMVAHYIHAISSGSEKRSIKEVFEVDGHFAYIDRSRYYDQLVQYLRFYSASRILVVNMTDLRDRRRATLKRVLEFLGVNPDFRSIRWARRLHRSSGKRGKTKAGRRLARSKPVRLLERIPVEWRWVIERPLYWPLSRRIDPPELSHALRRELIGRLRNDVQQLRAFSGQNFQDWCL